MSEKNQTLIIGVILGLVIGILLTMLTGNDKLEAVEFTNENGMTSFKLKSKKILGTDILDSLWVNDATKDDMINWLRGRKFASLTFSDNDVVDISSSIKVLNPAHKLSQEILGFEKAGIGPFKVNADMGSITSPNYDIKENHAVIWHNSKYAGKKIRISTTDRTNMVDLYCPRLPHLGSPTVQEETTKLFHFHVSESIYKKLLGEKNTADGKLAVIISEID